MLRATLGGGLFMYKCWSRFRQRGKEYGVPYTRTNGRARKHDPGAIGGIESWRAYAKQCKETGTAPTCIPENLLSTLKEEGLL